MRLRFLPFIFFAVLLVLPSPLHAQGEPVEITGASRAEYDDRTGVWVLQGEEVLLRKGDLELRAPFVRYSQKERVAFASGGVVARSRDQEVRAPEVQVFLEEERAVAHGGAMVRYSREDGETTLTADWITAWWGEGRAVAEGNVVVTSTEATAPATPGEGVTVTTLHAQRVQVWDRGRRAVAEGSVTVHRGDTVLTGERLEVDQRKETIVVSGSPWVRVKDTEGRAGLIEARTREEVVFLRGGVRITRGSLEATAPEGEIRRKEGWARLSGGVTLIRTVEGKRDLLTAESMTVYLDEERVLAEGSPRAVVYLRP
ncbi:MAG: LptA/OstA family protein [Armatimonadota bacterium]|nr:LptA/OstA family protein [Armatimonadota bacterium]